MSEVSIPLVPDPHRNPVTINLGKRTVRTHISAHKQSKPVGYILQAILEDRRRLVSLPNQTEYTRLRNLTTSSTGPNQNILH